MTNENGLLRYDGRNFKVFNSENVKLTSNRFTYITGNIQKDSLFTYTEDFNDALLITNRNTKKISGFSKKLDFNTYEGMLYLSSYHNNANLDFTNTKIGCENDSYYVIGNKNISAFNTKNELIKKIDKDYQKNTLYFLYENELVLFDFKNNKYTFFSDEFKNRNSLVIPKDGKFIYNPIVQQLFIYTDKEIYILKKVANQFYLKKVFEKSKLNLNIKSLYFDSKDNKLFIGTLDKGLNVISKKEFRTIIDTQNSNNNYYATIPVSDDLFITSNGLLFNKYGLVKDLKMNRSENQYAVALDKQKNIWIPEGNKIYKFNKNTNYTTKEIFDLKQPILTIYCDSNNKIWIGTKKIENSLPNVFYLDASKSKTNFERLKNVQESIVFFTETPEKELIMISNQNMIFYNSTTQKIKKISSGINNIRSAFVAKDKSIWVCTYNNGFSLFKNNRFHKMPYDDKMYLLSSHCIQEDKRGHFWISTNKGLIEVDKQSLLNYYNLKTPVYYHHYTNKNGFLTNEFNGGCQPCASTLKNNFIYPSLNGLVIFNPEETKKIIPTNKFFINEAELDGSTHYFADTLHIGRDIERIKFKIDFAYFGNSENVFFEGKLDASENKKWIQLTNENEINFTNLTPGTHQLFIRRIIPFTSNYEIKKIVIEIPFFFYERIWFKILSSLLLIALIAFILRTRYNLIRAKNLQLEVVVKDRTADLFDTITSLKITQANLNQEILQQKKLVGTISHDIKSPLKFLSITAKYLEEKTTFSDDAAVKENAKIMHDSAIQLYRFVENLVDYSKVFIEHDEYQSSNKTLIDDIIIEKIKLFKNIAEANKTKLHFETISNKKIYVNKRIFGIIIHNLLDNAIKNTTEGQVTIGIEILNKKVLISVEDNGFGMPDEIKKYYMEVQKDYENDKLALQNYGLGLHMVLELLRIVKGEMRIYSKLKSGTKVIIIIDED